MNKDKDVPATPGTIAINLLALAEAHEQLQPAPASSGSSILDEAALEGGLRYGEITSIAGASGMGKSLVGFSIACGHAIFTGSAFADSGGR